MSLLSVNSAGALVIPIEAGFQKLYSLAIPDNAEFDATAPAYGTDNSGSIADGSFDRVAYYLELQTATGPLTWVWASFDTPSANASHLGIPAIKGSVQTFDQIVSNMNVFASAGAPVSTGTGIATGNIEFGSSNYQPAGNLGLGGNDQLYDFDDSGLTDAGGYGSMQVHNYGARETIFAYNQWNFGGGVSDLGIGNQATGQPDWTFAGNADTYTVRNLEVWVDGDSVSVPVSEPGTIAILGLGLAGLGLMRRRRRSA